MTNGTKQKETIGHHINLFLAKYDTHLVLAIFASFAVLAAIGQFNNNSDEAAIYTPTSCLDELGNKMEDAKAISIDGDLVGYTFKHGDERVSIVANAEENSSLAREYEMYSCVNTAQG